MALNKELLDILACPKCKSDLELARPEDGPKDGPKNGPEGGLICVPCKVVYPIKEEIPIMLIDEAVPLADWENGIRENRRGQATR